MADNIKELLKCDLFSFINEGEIIDILDRLNVKETKFLKGDILAMQDEPCNRLIILTSGSVKAEMTDPSGKVVKVEDISAPSPLAILFLFGVNNRFPVQATAREDVTALVIPKSSVLKMLQMNEHILENYLNISAIYASKLSKKLHFMSFRTIRQKIALYLLDLMKEGDFLVEMDRTQNSLAEFFGVSRPSLAREMYNMQEDGLIEVNRKHIRILDKHKLIQLVKF
ncbi:MAG: Crp/Fnr family transcriptional regulator [Prevotella sp.]|jgi:CRP-like cAMP-binding protein|nr:Crp/Fnr family transcriptional regulator [Prevotella sp.]